ncbi:MAG: ATP-binding protein [Candidatus Aenigmarchaeota archaeon]|nr:ATP-binding protein [Candidatus Aenigmarchaeota archaeon]
MYIKRDAEKTIEKIYRVYKIMAVVGARQAGKTTLLRNTLEKQKGDYITLDDPDAREMFDEDIKKFENQYLKKGKLTGIDEIQYGKDAGIKLKYLADKEYKLFITSSSEIIMGKNVLSYLVGRVSATKLFPFSLHEILRAKKLKEMTEKIKERVIWEYANYGGYPKVVLEEDFEIRKDILNNLKETLILKDVMQTFSIEDMGSLEKLLNYLAVGLGNIVSYEKLSSKLDISFITLKKYLDALEKSYVIKTVPPFYTNKLKEITKRPKIYFIDVGLRNSIIKNFNSEPEDKILENLVLMELLKKNFSVKYWSTKAKAEVDFIIEKEGEIIPIEVKTSVKINKSLKSFIAKYKPKTAFVVFHKGEEREEIIDGCKVICTNLFGLIEKL